MLILIIFLIILITPLVVIYLSTSIHDNKMNLITKQKMELFAKEYELNFEPNSEIKNKEKEETFQLFKEGINRKISNYVFGKYKNYPVEIYTYKHRLMGAGNCWFEYLVLELNVKKILPKCIISASHHINFNDDFITLHYPNDLPTESNEFNYYYNIYIDKSSSNNPESNVLEILTPDLMVLLIDQYKNNKNKNIITDYIEMNADKFIFCKRINYPDVGIPLDESFLPNMISYFKRPHIVRNEEDFKIILDTGLTILGKIDK